MLQPNLHPVRHEPELCELRQRVLDAFYVREQWLEWHLHAK
jgi:hypothetical protein